MDMVIFMLKQIQVIYSYLHKKIKKVMSFKAKHIVTKDNSNVDYIKKNVNSNNIQLSKQEIELLLRTIKNSHFSGDMLESLYTLVYKLQTHYNKIK